MSRKVTFKDFITVQSKIMADLFRVYKIDAIIITVLLSSLCLRDVLNVKFIEHLTNSVYSLAGDGSGNLTFILIKTSVFIGVIITAYVINWIYSRFDSRFKEKVQYDIERKFKEKLSVIPYEYFENNQFHEKIKRAKKAGSEYGNAVYSISQFLRIAVIMIIYSIILARFSWVFPVILLAANIISFFIAGKVTDWQLDHWRVYVSPSERRMWYFEDIAGNRINQQTIQTGRLFPYFAGLFEKWNTATMWTYFKLNYYCILSELASVLIMGIVYGGTVYVIGSKVISGEVEIGYFTMVIALLMNLFSVMKDYTMFIFQRSWFIRVIQDYNDVMETPEIQAQDVAERGEFLNIYAKNISYKYPQSEKYALNDISFDFKAGERIAIVGHNGSGKTTMTGLLMGLFRTYDGDISLNGENIDKEKIEIISDSISSLQQDFEHYQMSIRQNIELGNKGNPLSDEKITEILKNVGLYEYVSSLEKGFDTPLGQLEKGVELSKGQWQKLAAARLLANENAKIWILDEPTAYLDPIAEIDMYNFINSLITNQTVFFISHRLGFAKQAERILVFDGGSIAEQGGHNELMSERGLYYKMYEAQKSWYA